MRIVHDCIEAIDAVYAVYKVEGTIVLGFCDRIGIRSNNEDRGGFIHDCAYLNLQYFLLNPNLFPM